MNINPLSHILMFDVDETLAESGQPLSSDVCDVLDYLQNVHNYQLAFATSRSYAELQKRIPANTLENAYAFCSMGMEMWYKNEMKYQHHFNWPKGLTETLNAVSLNSHCPHKTGKHIVIRPSMGAFTPLGEGATKKQRAEFIEWNKQTNFLQRAKEVLAMNFPSLNFEIFGKTTIDFSDKEMSKAVILPELRKLTYDNVVFFADNMQKGGNDFELAEALKAEHSKNINRHVSSIEETLHHLYNIKHHGSV